MVLIEEFMVDAVCRHAMHAVWNDESKGLEIQKASMEAFQTVYQRVRGYMGDYLDFRLCLAILYRKGRMIEEARTKAELNEISKPSVPVKTYSGFREGLYHVPEEEILLWSYVSMETPLNDEGYHRYMELFARFFPEAAKKICV